MRLAVVRLVLPLLLVLGGCGQNWRSQFPDGTRLYEKGSRQYFGKVVRYDPRHDFHNGTPPEAAIQIELADGGQEPVWGSCATCAATFQAEPTK